MGSRARRAALGAIALAALAAAAAPAGRGGAERAAGCPPSVTPPTERVITHPRWLSGVLITEYYPAPEAWFHGRLVRAVGLPGRHRIDWLYSARGLAMQGEGIGADGRFYHFAGPYSLTWHAASGAATIPCRRAPGAWTHGSPSWLGTPGKARFAPGRSLPLSYWHDVAVDPRLIPHGSSVFVPVYCGTPSHGWFVAADTGGAIIGPHLDVFRAPPAVPWSSGLHRDARVYVVPPGFRRPASLHC
jgi:hypothetical protein